MSHFTRIKTQIVEKEHLLTALSDLGYTYEEGNISVRGYKNKQTSAEIKVPTKNPKYDIGFRKQGDSYEIVADWWGIKGINRKQFQQQLTQRYAYHTAKAKLAVQGFNLVNEQVDDKGEIHLVLRRMA